jgi:hypothetical protein
MFNISLYELTDFIVGLVEEGVVDIDGAAAPAAVAADDEEDG